jgi:hypothetical protein
LFWALFLVWLVLSVPFVAHWLGTETAGRVAAAAPPEEEPRGFVQAERQLAGVSVPEAAVVEIDGKPSVLVAERDLRLLVATPVELGEQLHGQRRHIMGGVAAGQFVVADATSAHHRLAMH